MELRHYLLGEKSTLVTDHAAVSLLGNHKDPHHRLARWVAELQAFEFEVVYNKGSLHIDADCMSRLIDDSAQEDTDSEPYLEAFQLIHHVTTQSSRNEQERNEIPEIRIIDEIDERTVDIRAEQREDELCGKIMKILESDLTETEKDKRCRNYAFIDDQLHRLRPRGPPTLVVPTNRRGALLISLHDSPSGGYLGFYKTHGKIKERYYWPGMHRDIKKYVVSCNKCQRRSLKHSKARIN